jgi:dienelactone hydrolase
VGPLPPLAPLEMTLQAGDGLVLKGVLAYPDAPPGKPHPLAVLAHQYPATADSFAPLIDDLLDLGIAALAFDERGHGASTQGPAGPVVIECPVDFGLEAFGQAFMSSAARVGFDRIDDDVVRVACWGVAQNFVDPARVLLFGASVGGTGVVLAAPRIRGLRAVVTFGAAGELVWGPDGRARARKAVERITAPALFTTSEGDPFAALANARAWSDGLAHARVKAVPGDAHAMAIYYEVRDEVLALVKKAVA